MINRPKEECPAHFSDKKVEKKKKKKGPPRPFFFYREELIYDSKVWTAPRIKGGGFFGGFGQIYYLFRLKIKDSLKEIVERATRKYNESMGIAKKKI